MAIRRGGKLEYIMCEISVIILTNDSESLRERAIHSVLCQSFSDFELLIVDNGFSKKSFSIIRSLKDFRIKYEKKELDRIEALNWGIINAKGKYIAFLDGRTLMHPDRLRIQHALMEENSNITICGSWIKHIDKYSLSQVRQSLSGLVEKPLLAFLEGDFLFYSTIMIRKNFLTINKLKYEEFTGQSSLRLGVEIAKKRGVLYIDSQFLQYSYDNNTQIEKRDLQNSDQEFNYVLTSLIELNKSEFPEMQILLDNFESLRKKNILKSVEIISFFRNVFKNKDKFIVSQ